MYITKEGKFNTRDIERLYWQQPEINSLLKAKPIYNQYLLDKCIM